MSDSKALIRQWRLLRLLADARHGYTVRELQTEMSVSLETVRRDLKDLQDVGFRVCETVGFRGVKRWRVEGFDEAFQLNIADLISIYMGRQLLEPLAGTPFWDGQQKVFNRIRGRLSDSAVQYLEKLGRTIQTTRVGAGDYSQRSEMIDRLMVAVEDGLVSLIRYRSDESREAEVKEVYPQGFVFHRGSLYLIAWSVDRCAIRTYKMDRVEGVESTKRQASLPIKFDLADWLENGFGIFGGTEGKVQTVRVHFSSAVARYVRESRWHRSQKFSNEQDGSLLAEFQLTETQEIKRWIMSFGPEATILSPQELVDDIKADLDMMRSRYQMVAEGVRE